MGYWPQHGTSGYQEWEEFRKRYIANLEPTVTEQDNVIDAKSERVDDKPYKVIEPPKKSKWGKQ
jgi:hypothetical protein